MRGKVRSFVALSMSAFVLVTAPTSHGFLSFEQTRCLTAITTEGRRFVNAKLSVIRRCKDADFKEAALYDTDAVALAVIDDRPHSGSTIGARSAGEPRRHGLCLPGPESGRRLTTDPKGSDATNHQAAVDAIAEAYDPTITGTSLAICTATTVARRRAELAAVLAACRSAERPSAVARCRASIVARLIICRRRRRSQKPRASCVTTSTGAAPMSRRYACTSATRTRPRHKAPPTASAMPWAG
jgi:hypothetical protein